MIWVVYIVECSDGTLYTGITTHIGKRLEKHNSGKGAKYTRSRTPVNLVYCKEYENKSLASKEEWRIKQLTKEEKLDIINEQSYLEELQWEEEQRRRLNDLYTYGEDGFCDGFTKY